MCVRFQITRSLSNISPRRESATAKTAAAASSEVACAELSCYGVFRKLEPDDYSGGGERVIVGRPRRPRRDGGAFSPQEPALTYATPTTTTAAGNRDDSDSDSDGYGRRGRDADADDADDDLFEPGTYSVYDCDSSCCDASTAAAAAAATTDTTTCSSLASASDATTTTGPPRSTSTAGRRPRGTAGRESATSDFGAAAASWDDRNGDGFGAGCPAGVALQDTAVAATTADTRGGGVVVGGAAGAPFSHTPMGSTTKLVGIDANSDDAPKVRYVCFTPVCRRPGWSNLL